MKIEQFPDATVPRRSFFKTIVAAGSACVGAIFAIPLVRAAIFPLRAGGQTQGETGWSDLGAVENFSSSIVPATQVVTIQRQDGWQLTKVQQPVYVFAGSGTTQPRVLSSVCPHLGCTVQWRTETGNFVCPCHNGTYAPDGARLSGPPKRGMDELPSRVQDGHLQVQFQYYRQLSETKELAG